MSTAIVTLPNGKRARITYQTQEQLTAAINDLAAGAAARPATGSTNPDGVPIPVELRSPQERAPIQPQRPASFSDQVREFLRSGARQLGLGARDIVNAAASPFALATDSVLQTSNALLGTEFTPASQALNEGLSQAGLPEPESTVERYTSAVNRAVAGGGGTIALGSRLAQGGGTAAQVGQSLAAQPTGQLTGTISGTVAAESAKDAGFGQTGQAVAGLAGGIAGSGALRPLIAEGVKRSFRGGEAGRVRTKENIETFEAATGSTPSAGQATGARRVVSAESLLSRTPGGAGVMSRNAEKLADDLADTLDAKATKLSPKATAEQAGREIEKSIKGEGGFIEAFKAKQVELYDKLDEHIPSGAQVDMSNTRKSLKALNQEIENAPELSKWFQNAKLKGIERALGSDAEIPPGEMVIPPKMTTERGRGALGEPTERPVVVPEQRIPVPAGDRGWMPYESLKKLRTLVGNEIADAGIMSDVPRSKWKALYAALSQDLEQAAKKSGPQAENAWRRANGYTKAGIARLDSISHVIDKNGGPERVFEAALSGTKEGATTLRAVMQSLPKESQKVLTAAVIRRLGKAVASSQNDSGDVFSVETFLTNWNKLSPQAKATLFDRYGPDFRADMDKVAKMASIVRSGSQVFRNPSGTAGAAVQGGTVGAFLLSVVTGNVGGAAAIGAGVSSAYGSARLMTNPKFVKWLAKQTDKPAAAIPVALNQLAASSDPELAEIGQELRQAVSDRGQ